MAKEGKVSRRYARALFELYDVAQLEAVQNALTALAKTWTDRPALRSAMLNPAYPTAQRHAALRDVAQKIRSGDATFANFTAILLENSRLGVLPEIAVAFTAMVDIVRKRLALEITSAHAVDEPERSEMNGRIQREFGSMASIAWKVDPEIIGGLLIKSGDRMLDTSVRGALENLQHELLS